MTRGRFFHTTDQLLTPFPTALLSLSLVGASARGEVHELPDTASGGHEIGFMRFLFGVARIFYDQLVISSPGPLLYPASWTKAACLGTLHSSGAHESYSSKFMK